MKVESRRAVLVRDELYSMCVFRGNLLEHVFFGRSQEEVVLQAKEHGIEGEIKGLSDDLELVKVCLDLLKQVEEKLKRIGTLS
mgnify:FL=1